jgi:hypothetical protein
MTGLLTFKVCGNRSTSKQPTEMKKENPSTPKASDVPMNVMQSAPIAGPID